MSALSGKEKRGDSGFRRLGGRGLAVGPLALGWLCAVAFLGVARTEAHTDRPAQLRDVGLDQRLNEQVPLDLAFRDETGSTVHLADYLGQKPVILALVYYHCQNLCPLVLEALARSLRALSFDAGDQFEVVAVSIDPGDTPAFAASQKQITVHRYARPGAAAGWHFLTGEEPSIRRLAAAVGFRYARDAESDQYAHPSGIMVLSPQGRISRYFYGVEYSPRDLRLGLVEARANRTGSLVDQLLLFCYRYDPATGRYGLVIMNVIRLAGLATALALATFIGVMLRRDRRRHLGTGGRGLDVGAVRPTIEH